MMMPNNCNIGSVLRALSGYGRLTPWHGMIYSRSYEAAKPHKNSLSSRWSSTEYNSGNSWYVYFYDGSVNGNNKCYTRVVRPAVAHPTKAWLQLRETIQLAYIDCCRGKRSGRQYQDYLSIANEDLDLLTTELMEGTYKPSASTCFLAKFPKLREVFAAAFRDRVIHHWMCMRLVPLFEKLNREIGDVTHNCRVGYGTKSAVDSVYNAIKRITHNYGQEAYVFRAANKSLFRTAKGRGAPIGNHTTQQFANYYMADFDAYMMNCIKQLRSRKIRCDYQRFVDDFLLICNDKKALKWLIKMAENKIKELGLTMHKDKRYCQPASRGVMFVGSYIKNHRIYLSNRTIDRFKDKVSQIYQYLNQPSVKVTSADLDHILATLNSYLGFCVGKRTFRLRRRIMRPLKYSPGFCKLLLCQRCHDQSELKKEIQNYYYIKDFT